MQNSNNTPEHLLANRGIVVTRPAEQAQTLADLIRQSGGEPVLFPLLEIIPVQDYREFDAVIDQLDRADWAIFISSNAVRHGMSRLIAHRRLPPPEMRYAAVGPMTAAELADFGVHEVLTPTERFDSESLLNLPEMRAVAGKFCVIFRGVGGRDLLADTLAERGAEVAFAECYQRTNPSPDLQPLAHLRENGRLHALVVTSSEALRNLLQLAKGAAWLKDTPIFVNHPRIAEAAREQGLRAIVADKPGDIGMLATLETYFKKS